MESGTGKGFGKDIGRLVRSRNILGSKGRGHQLQCILIFHELGMKDGGC